MAIMMISLYDSSRSRVDAKKKMAVDNVKKIRSGSRFFNFFLNLFSCLLSIYIYII